MPPTRWDKRVNAGDWNAIAAAVDEYGGALLPRLLTPDRDPTGAQAVRQGPTVPRHHRHGASSLRLRPVSLFPRSLSGADRASQAGVVSAAVADRPGLVDQARRDAPWPDSLDEWLDMCHAAGQTRPTALMLRYGTDDWNALHRDLYGDLVFPLQVVINLSDPDTEYTGGEFMLVEQRARAQSRGTATQLPQGHGYLFTTRDRPVRSARGWSAAAVRHGLSVVRSGQRYALGLIFHDAA